MPPENDDGTGLETEIPGVHGSTDIDDKIGDDKDGEVNGAQALGAMISTMQEMGTSMKAISDRLGKLEEGDVAPIADPKDDTDDDGPVDLDLMSNSELVAHLLKEMKGEIAPLTERMQTGEAETLRHRAETEVDRLSSAHKDFIEFKNEMKSELEENGSLTIEQAYKLAKSNNPEKVIKLDKARQDEKNKTDPEEPRFGGLLPTSGIARKSARMTQTDAALNAWDEIFGSRGDANS